MELSFYARAGHVMRPYGSVATGQFMTALGRGSKPTKRGIEMPAKREPLVVDSKSKNGAKILRRIRQTPDNPCMWPANPETAQACGIPFVSVDLGDDGEYAVRSVPVEQPEAYLAKTGGDK